MQKIFISTVIAGIAAAGLLTGATGAHAQTLSYVTSTPIALTKTDFTGGLTFTKFDSSLGTLVSVQLSVQSAIQTQLTVSNSAATASNGNARTQVTISIYDDGGYLTKPGVDAFGDPVPGAYNVGILSPRYNYSLAPGASSTSGMLTANGSQSSTFTAAADGALVSQFIGGAGSSITLGVGTDTRTIISNNGGNSASTQTTKASATGTVVYTYIAAPPAAVPEPGIVTFGLTGGAGVFGMVLRGRRNGKKNAA